MPDVPWSDDCGHARSLHGPVIAALLDGFPEQEKEEDVRQVQCLIKIACASSPARFDLSDII